MAVFLVNQARPAQAQATEVWSADLTVGNLPPNAWRGYSKILMRGQLSDRDFVFQGVTYEITNLTDRGNGDVLLELNRAIPDSLKQALVLTIRGRQFALVDAVSPNANILRWNNTGWRFSLDDVVNVKLIKPATTPAPAPVTPPDATDTNNVWSATLTVGQATFGRGYLDTGTVGTLSPGTFTHDGVSYSIRRFVFNTGNGNLQLFLNNAIPNDLQRVGILTLGDREFALADATIGTTGATANGAATWANAGLSWSVGDTVQVSLAETPLALTASFSPFPGEPVQEDWETNSAHDLWSPTLTVQNLGTTASPNLGCDDSNPSARCRTRNVLTDNDFTFKGVAYTVKAISHVTTYPQRLKLTLDKTIPESLQSCLTLHSGNAKVRLAGDRVPGAGVDTVLSESNGVPNSTLTLTEISGVGFGLNWSAGDMVQLRLPNVGCLTMTLSEPVDRETSMQRRRGGTADQYSDYHYIKLPTFAAGSTSASTPIRVIDDNSSEGCENITMNMTMWPGTDRAISEFYRVYIEDDDGGNACPTKEQRRPYESGGL